MFERCGELPHEQCPGDVRRVRESVGVEGKRGSVVGRYYGASVSVVEDQGRPLRFTWNGRVYGVRRIIDHWVTLRMDWTPTIEPRVPERRHWRVEAGALEAQGVYELLHDAVSDQWLLSRVWD